MVIKKKFLIAFIGPVGSGKTYIARILVRKLGAIHVRADDIRVALRRGGKTASVSMVRRIGAEKIKEGFRRGKSVISDFDAVHARRRRELARFAKRFGAKAVFIKIETPEKIILKRLRRHRYGKNDLLRSREEAVRVYFIRRKFHRKPLRPKPDFVINNARPLGPQIQRIVKKVRN